MKPILCHNKEKGINFVVVREDDQLKCHSCGNILEFGSSVIVHQCYSRLVPYEKKYYCSSGCTKGINYRDQSELRTALLTSVFPENVVLINDRPTEMKPGQNISAFEAAKLESERTIDRTKYADRESLEGAAIGNKEYLIHDKEKNKNLSAEKFEKEIMLYAGNGGKNRNDYL